MPTGMPLLSYFRIVSIALLFLTKITSFVEAHVPPNDTMSSCIPGEADALLAFRAGVTDPANVLSSWKGDDCCQWKGVHCSSRTSHVIKLDLQGTDCENSITSKQALGGNISSSLLGLRHLRYLDISCNRFNGSEIPEFLSSLQDLRYLDLSLSSFIGKIPPQLGNLSNLRYLNLDSTLGDTYSTDITWLSTLTYLEHLDMTFVNLTTVVDWLLVLNKLPALTALHLPLCGLSSSIASLPFSNLTSLETLDIEANNFKSRITPNWFWDLTSLKYLDIARNGFYGAFPDEIGNFTSIVELSLSDNNLVGMIPSNMKNLCNLKRLFSYSNNIDGSITEFLQRLPRCPRNKLEMLFLPGSNLTGTLPTSLEPLSNISWVDLSDNKLTGHVPLWIGQLTKLTTLVLNSNNFHGVIHEGHLSGLENLEELTLSDNSIAIKVSPTWVPPFNLTTIQLRSCQLGPKFPTWLRWQTGVFSLDISNTSISDVVPDWFWVVASAIPHLNTRHNQIRGVLPETMEFMRGIEMDFSSNQLSGPIPKLPIALKNIDLSRNNLSAPLPLDFGAPALETLLLFENSISGVIPPSLCNSGSLLLLDLSRNKLTGSPPDCLSGKPTTNMTSLRIRNLSLRNNELSGDFPSFLQVCQKLIILDLAHNQFVGTLPSWIGERMPSLAFLRLKSNMFHGHIPVELAKLVDLQYLDLSYNNLSGSIPKSIAKYTGMILPRGDGNELQDALRYYMEVDVNEIVDYSENFTVTTKGQERLYTGEIIYMVNLDLACNNLSGPIPGELGTLVALKSLNLSWNTFTAGLPENIGALVQVESLDLSHNGLSGEIPTSLSALTSLSRLNHSYNNLTGEIPSGNQLQTLNDEASIYIGNPGLCGPPLSKKCAQTGLILVIQENHEHASDDVSFFLGIGTGCVMGLWVVFCTFLFNKKWRVNWFTLYDRLCDWIYVQIAVIWASFKTEDG